MHKEPIKKFAVEYYETSCVSGGGYWNLVGFDNINDAVLLYLKHKSGHLGSFTPRFYLLQQVPLKISFAHKLKEFILRFKFPKKLNITIK